MRWSVIIIMLSALLVAPDTPVAAADREIPYWVSIRAKSMNARVGPSRDYKIVWRYERQQLPLKVIRVKEGWRMIRDQDGATGWVLQQFLSRERSAVVTGAGLAEMRAETGGQGRVLWQVEPGVVGKLGECADGWCRLDTGAGHAGYVAQGRLWGVGKP